MFYLHLSPWHRQPVRAHLKQTFSKLGEIEQNVKETHTRKITPTCHGPLSVYISMTLISINLFLMKNKIN